MRVLLSLLVLFFLALPAVQADRIWLRNGKDMEGRVENLADGRIELRTDFGSFRFNSNQVVRVERGSTFEDQVNEAVARLDPFDAQGRYELALLCGEKGYYSLQRRLLETVLRIDPEHAGARRDLGYQRYAGSWVTEEQMHELRGEVQFRGRWMPPEERSRILEEEDRTETARRQQERIEEALLDLQIATLQNRQAEPRFWYGEEIVYPLYPYPRPSIHHPPSADPEPTPLPSVFDRAPARSSTPTSHGGSFKLR